jgi:hypothetical protein
MSTVLCLALRTLFFFCSQRISISPLVPHFLSILLFYLHSLYCILYLCLVDLPLDFFYAPRVCAHTVVIARVVDSMSGRVFADKLEV